MKEYEIMKAARLFLLLLLLFIYLNVNSYADMTSWLDEDGVRHYSNRAAPDGDTTFENMEEFKHQKEDVVVEQKGNQRNPFSVLQMYEKDRKRDLDEKLLKETRIYHERVKEAIEDSKRENRKRQEELCRKAKKRYDVLRSLGWKDYTASHQEVRRVKDRLILDSHGRVHNSDLDDRQKEVMKMVYNRAVKAQEKEVEKACAR